MGIIIHHWVLVAHVFYRMNCLCDDRGWYQRLILYMYCHATVVCILNLIPSVFSLSLHKFYNFYHFYPQI